MSSLIEHLYFSSLILAKAGTCSSLWLAVVSSPFQYSFLIVSGICALSNLSRTIAMCCATQQKVFRAIEKEGYA